MEAGLQSICNESSTIQRERRFSEYYKQVSGHLLSYLLGFDNCDIEHGQSIIQDVLIKAYQNLDNYCERLKSDPIYNWTGYLIVCARNDFFRSLEERQKIEQAEIEFYPDNDSEDSFSQHELKQTKELVLELSRECQKKISKKYDYILNQRFVENRRLRDIAYELGANYSYLRLEVPKWLRIIRDCCEKRLRDEE